MVPDGKVPFGSVVPATGVTLEYSSPVAFAAATDVCHVAKVAVPPPEHTLPVPLATTVAVGHPQEVHIAGDVTTGVAAVGHVPAASLHLTNIGLAPVAPV